MLTTKNDRCFMVAALVVLLVGFFIPSKSSAQYPQKPIRLIIPYVAGGTPDLAVRVLLGHGLHDRLGQRIVVDTCCPHESLIL